VDGLGARVATLLATVLLLGLVLWVPNELDAGKPGPAPTGCVSRTATFYFHIYAALAKITFGSKTYVNGGSASVSVGCGQSYTLKMVQPGSSVSFYQWATTSDGQISDYKASSTKFIAGNTGGSIELILLKGSTMSYLQYGGYTLMGNTKPSVSAQFTIPAFNYVPGGPDPDHQEDELAIGVGFGGVNGRGWWTFLVVKVAQSDSASFFAQSYYVRGPAEPTPVMDPYPSSPEAMSWVQVGDTITVTVTWTATPTDSAYLGRVDANVCDETRGGCASPHSARLRRDDPYAAPIDINTVAWMALNLRDCGYQSSAPVACHVVPSWASPLTFSIPTPYRDSPVLRGALVHTRGTGVYPGLPLDIIPGYIAGTNSFSLFYRSAEDTAPTEPGTPTWVQYDELDDGAFTLSWAPSTDSGSGLLQYEVQQQLAGSSWSVLGAQVQGTSHLVGPVSPGTYYYRVRAVDKAGNWGAYSQASAPVVVPQHDPYPPSAPGTPFWTQGDQNDGIVTLTWTAATDADDPILRYVVEQKVGTGAWYLVGFAFTNTYTTPRLTAGTYYYRTLAEDTTGNFGPYSASSAALVVPLDLPLFKTTGASTTPAIALDTGGNPHIAWVENGNRLHYAKLDANGVILVGDTLLTTSFRTVAGPALAVASDGTITVVWADSRGDGFEIYYSRYTGSWSSAAIMSATAGEAKEPDVAVDSAGNWHFVWRTVCRDNVYQGCSYEEESVQYEKNNPIAGQPTTLFWLNGARISETHNDRLSSPRIALGNGGTMHVAFIKGPAYDGVNYYDIDRTSTLHYVRYTGGAWGVAQTRDSENPAPPKRAAIEADQESRVYLVWERMTGGDIRLFRSTNAGTDWGPAQDIVASSGTQQSPDIGIGGSGYILVVFSDNSFGQFEIAYVRSVDYGVHWSSSTRLTYAAGDSLFPRLTVNQGSGSTTIVWQDVRESNWDIYYAVKAL